MSQVGKVVLYDNIFNKTEYFQLAVIQKQGKGFILNHVEIPKGTYNCDINKKLLIETIVSISSDIGNKNLSQLKSYAKLYCNEISIIID